MRLKLLLAGLLILLPVPALADVTAQYSAGPKDRLVIEADDGGNARASIGEKVAVIRRDGVDYVLVADATGDFRVARLGDVLALVAGQLKGKQGGDGAGLPALTFEMRAGAEENVAGYGGTIWIFGPKPEAPGKEAGQQLEVVMSGDPALAPIGLFFRQLVEAGNPLIDSMFGGGNFPTASAELFAKGTPLRIGPMLKLESVSTAEIAASRFDLPGPVLEPIEFLEAITPSQSGGGLPPLP